MRKVSALISSMLTMLCTSNFAANLNTAHRQLEIIMQRQDFQMDEVPFKLAFFLISMRLSRPSTTARFLGAAILQPAAMSRPSGSPRLCTENIMP